jgi:hypothetical protein
MTLSPPVLLPVGLVFFFAFQYQIKKDILSMQRFIKFFSLLQGRPILFLPCAQ